MTEAGDRDRIELQQQIDALRAQLEQAEARAERPDAWDPKVWASRASRIGSMGARAVRRAKAAASGPRAKRATDRRRPSSFPAWQRRLEGARFVGFPTHWRERTGPAAPAPIAVVLHCHYAELLDELLAALPTIGEPFDLYVTNSSGETITAARLAAAGAAHAEVLTVENHGRDIWPLVQVVNAGILDAYDVVLKVHTKRSEWREGHGELSGSGEEWRAALVGSLLGSPERTSAIVDAFRRDRSIGIVTADGSVAGPEHWGSNLDLVRGFLERLSMPLEPDDLRFAAGSMYWIRGFLLQSLRALRIDRADFEEEAGQIDGTAAHAVERIIGIGAVEAGMDVLELRELDDRDDRASVDGRVVAFYLPQFHRTAENDRWWGAGFTEWANVAKAKPLYPGHLVPLMPGELGFYDLALDEVRQRQRDLAAAHGIAGFMYYHYWFAGRRVLGLPLQRLADGDVDQPFCVMWANENWTRRWDGRDADVLVGQDYDRVPATEFIEDILPMLRDPRWMRVDGAAIVAVYKIGTVPDAAATIAHWRERARAEGAGELHVLAVDIGEQMGGLPRPELVDLADGTLTFAPHNLPWIPSDRAAEVDERFAGNLMGYRGTADAAIAQLADFDEHHHPGVMVTFDNTARKQWTPMAFTGANPWTFRRWLAAALEAQADRPLERRIVFVNAWNEWAESAVLEPTEQFGQTYLLACRQVAPPR